MNIEEIREICLQLPHVTEDVKWGSDLVFSVADKMFCVASLSDVPANVAFKVKADEFEDMCTRNGIVAAPYFARYKWVKVENIQEMSKKEYVHYIGQSYQLVRDKLSPKRKKELE